MPCELIDLNQQTFDYDHHTSYFFNHLNISSLQLHFDELLNFRHTFSNLPAIIFITETRINVDTYVNITIPDYTFFHKPSHTKADGVGAYVSRKLNFKILDNLSINVHGCLVQCRFSRLQ